jgi:hypothetical protein
LFEIDAFSSPFLFQQSKGYQLIKANHHQGSGSINYIGDFFRGHLTIAQYLKRLHLNRR